MALVGAAPRQPRGLPVAFPGAGQTHAILAAYPATNNTVQNPLPTPPPSPDVQPDRPIGYGAFGVVW